MNNLKNQYHVGKLYVIKFYILSSTTNIKNSKIKSKKFWEGLDKSLYELREKNEKFLHIRKELQNSIDNWHLNNKGKKFNIKKYKRFLLNIGYLKKKRSNFKIQTKNFDE